jgi:hypothetical protein
MELLEEISLLALAMTFGLGLTQFSLRSEK